MKLSVIILIVLLSFQNVYAQSEPQDVINKFFNEYNEEKSDQAIDYLFSNSPAGLSLVADYYISVGKAGIAKVIEGDQRTPLGKKFLYKAFSA